MGYGSSQPEPGGSASAASAPVCTLRINPLQGLFGDRIGASERRFGPRTIPPRLI
jgi:hypothetical protein